MKEVRERRRKEAEEAERKRRSFSGRLKAFFNQPPVVVSCIVLIIIFFVWLQWYTYEPPRRYCGKVTELLISKPYYDNYHGEMVQPIPYVVFFSDSLHKYIGVRTTLNDYEQLRVGSNVCFHLDWRQVQ